MAEKPIMEHLSESADGRQIKVEATSSPGTLIHLVPDHEWTGYEAVTLYAANNGAADYLLTIQWGGTTAPDDNLEVVVPSKAGPVPVVAGLVLGRSGAVRAFAAAADVVMLSGYIERVQLP